MNETDILASVLKLYQAEYFHLLETYESFNSQSLTIKGWSVTVGMGSLLAAYLAKPDEKPGRFAVFIAAASVLPFYLTDALWKAVQGGYKLRLLELEQAIASGKEISPLQAMTMWDKHFELGITEYLCALTNSTVYLPHLPIFFAGILLGWLRPPNARQE